jgi:PPIC-type PPIASE domain
VNGSRALRSIVALACAVVGWSWLNSHMLGGVVPRPAPKPLDATAASKAPVVATRTIAGRALDTHGRPVAGATVWLTRKEESDNDISVPVVFGQTQTRADGRFELAAAVSELERTHGPLGVEVWIGKSGFDVAHRFYLGEPRQQPLVVRLVAETRFAIRVDKPGGSPCVGATVTPVYFWVAADRCVLPKEIQNWLRRPVAADGRVEVFGWNHGDADIAIESEEFGVQTASLVAEEGACVPVMLRRTRRVEGRLLLPEGITADVSRLRLILIQSSRGGHDAARSNGGPDQPAPSRAVFWRDRYVARPDRDGRFAFSKLPSERSGKMRLRLKGLGALGLADDADSECDLADIPAGETLKIDLPLRKGVWATWITRDAHTKRPVAGVRVSLLGSNEFRCSGTTDETGSARFCLAPGETYALACDLPDGYVRTLFGSEAYVEIPPGTTPPELPPIELVRGCPLEGQALDAGGQPLAGVRVKAAWQTCETKAGKKPANVTQRVTSDAQGHFRFEQVEAGAAVRLTATRAGVLLAEPADVVAGDGRLVHLREQKRDLVALTGRIVGGFHQPVPGASIIVEVADSPDPLGAFRTTVEPDGSFRTPREFPRSLKYRVTVRSLLTDLRSSAWLCPAASGNRFADLSIDSTSLTSKLSGKEVVARVDGHPIFAQAILERAYTEPVNAGGQALLAASKALAEGEMAEGDYRALQESAIKRFLSEFIGTRFTAEALRAKLDAKETRRIEEAINTEFGDYLLRLKRDFNVTTLQEMDTKLQEQGTSLLSLKAEFRYHLLSDEYVRGALPQRGSIGRPELLEYYRSHRNSFATPERVAWQLLEIACDKSVEPVRLAAAQTDQRDTGLPLYNKIGREMEAEPGLEMVKSNLWSVQRSFNAIRAYALNEGPDAEPADPKKDSEQSGDSGQSAGSNVGLTVAAVPSAGPTKVRPLVDDLLTRLRHGASFDALAKEFSDGPGAEQGGWQRLTRPSSIADAQTAAFLSQLAEGQTSEVIETDHALRIVRVAARIPASTRPFEKVEESIRETLTRERQQRAFDDLCSRATIESAFPMEPVATLRALQPAAPTFRDDSTP